MHGQPFAWGNVRVAPENCFSSRWARSARFPAQTGRSILTAAKSLFHAEDSGAGICANQQGPCEGACLRSPEVIRTLAFAALSWLVRLPVPQKGAKAVRGKSD